MKLHQHFEFGPASQDPFSFSQIQLALDTVKGKYQPIRNVRVGNVGVLLVETHLKQEEFCYLNLTNKY